MDGKCSTQRVNEECIQNFGRNAEGNKYLEMWTQTGE
jgi:hypothetical protein